MFALLSHSLLPRLLSGRCKTSGVRERGEDGTRTVGARTDSPGAAGSGSPNARSCDCGRSAACGRLKEQGSGSHDAASLPFFLPPSRASSLPPYLPLFLTPLPASAGGARSSSGCWRPAPESGGRLVPPGAGVVWGLMMLLSGFPLLRLYHVAFPGARLKSPVDSFADL